MPSDSQPLTISIPLSTISFSDLRNNNQAASATLLHACISNGFFYLDLHGPETSSFLEDVDSLYRLTENLYELPLAEKLKYDLDKIGPAKIAGYKPAGRNTGIEKGKQDGFEIYLIPKNDFASLTSHPVPEAVKAHWRLCAQFTQKAHWITTVLLASLSASLGFPANTDALQDYHRWERKCMSALGLLKYLPLSAQDNMSGQIAHTDVGSMTLLFSRLGGLQVLQRTTDQWGFVVPKPDHAVVNVGDSLRFLSNKVLNSSLHRVVPHPDSERQIRYSFAYFMRPEEEVRFEDEEGKEWSGIDWHMRKFVVFRAPLDEQRKDSVLTGKKGYLGLWKEIERDH